MTRARDSDDQDCLDLLIVGAGLSGIGAAYRIIQRNPALTYRLADRRARIGGTWDLFCYPGIRSDSDIFTLSFPWEPWLRPEAVAQGPHIREYLEDAARKHGIDSHIDFDTRIVAANWDPDVDRWTVLAQRDGVEVSYRCRFLFFATGYYSYDDPYTPEFAGLEDFHGAVVHPQQWPEDLDYSGKRLIVIGSGATAISMIPALTKKAAQVTMLQRSPGYIMNQRELNPVWNAVRRILPLRTAHAIVRSANAVLGAAFYHVARAAPTTIRRQARRRAVNALPPDYEVDVHFNPRYDPWDQRLCVALDDDFYKSISAGLVEVVTDHIDMFVADGIVLRSGRKLEADVVVTATGLQLQALGGVRISIAGEVINAHDRWVYKAHLLNDVPNVAWCIGYTNVSWTLRADMTARYVAKLLAYMRSHGYTHAYPHLGDVPMTEKPTFELASGYVMRSPRVLPRSGTRRPWMVRHSFLVDWIDFRLNRIREHMVFGRADRDQSTLKHVAGERIPLITNDGSWPPKSNCRIDSGVQRSASGMT
ncbi:MAG: NAD(P)/FAD-dependent oxidoreductase [Mycobacterium sp.]